MSDLRFIIRADQPYDGNTLSALKPDNIVYWTKGKTLAEYEAECSFPIRVIDAEEFDQLESDYEQSLVTDPEPETEEQFDYALGVLPPMRWHAHRGVTLFCMSETQRGAMTEWHAAIGDRYWRFTDSQFANSDYLADKVAAAMASTS